MIPHDVDYTILVKQLKSEELHVLMAMFLISGKYGNQRFCETNRPELNTFTRMGERALSAHIASLEAAGVIQRIRSDGRTVTWEMHPPRVTVQGEYNPIAFQPSGQGPRIPVM